MPFTPINLPADDTYQDSHARSVSVWGISFLSIVFLVLAHLAVKEYFPNPAFWLFGAMVIVATGLAWLLMRKDDFAFLMVIFVCSHFNFADNQGGFWSYVLFAVFLAAALFRYRTNLRISSVPLSTGIFLLIFLMHQFLGLILNPYSLVSNIQATIVTLSQMLVLYYCASQQMTEVNVKRLLSVWFAVVCWIFVIALNQKYHWVITTSPLLPQRFRDTGGYIAAIPAGSFGNSELFAEYFCIVFIIALVILSHTNEVAGLRIKKSFLLFILCISMASILMGSSRAAVILAVAAAASLMVITCVLTPSTKSLKRFALMVVVLSLSGLVMWKAGDLFALDDMIKDFEELNPSQINSESVISGKGINRSFEGAYKLLGRESWIVGKGYNLPENNTKSLGLRKGASDYHSLYVCIPFFYGWGGSAALVLLVMATGVRIFIYYLKNKRVSNALVPVALGLSVVWGAFLLDQYKISVTRNPSYFFLIWMLLGWTHAVANSLRSSVGNNEEPEWNN